MLRCVNSSHSIIVERCKGKQTYPHSHSLRNQILRIKHQDSQGYRRQDVVWGVNSNHSIIVEYCKGKQSHLNLYAIST